ncbi:MAG: hypothetical protein KKG76_00380 [Euryarchaeota archaeon]|nr:hypothetical protein [Euryarchaeota archaeon]MBU4140053.1 hypothetical protein [Euryarchaeota archaeon]
MTINVHLRKVDEKRYRLFKSAAAKKNVSLSRAFEEAIGIWTSDSDEISDEKATNDLIYKKMKKQLEKKYPGKYVVIADGKLLGAEDSLEKAWSLSSPYKNALVTKISKRPLRARMFGSSLRIATSERHEL